MLRNRAILKGFWAFHDDPPKSKVSLEIQGFAPPSATAPNSRIGS